VESEGQCLPAAGNDSGGSASAGTAGAKNGGTMNGGGTKNEGGSGSTVIGGSTAIEGGTGPVGNGGDEGIVGGNGGSSPEPEPEVLPTRWLVFSHQKGVFAYDTTKFPSTDGLLSLSDKAQGPSPFSVLWSPDGRTLFYVDQGNLYVVGMTGDMPGVPRLLVSSPAPQAQNLWPAPPWAWSADSASLALVTQTTLSVLDTSVAAPTLHPITTTLKEYGWAPAGDRLRYVDADGAHVVRVTHGAPGTPVAIDASASIWSPNGRQLVGPKAGEVALTTLGDDGASLRVLTDFYPDGADGAGGAGSGEGGGESGGGGGENVAPEPPPPDPNYVLFNKDGSKLSFTVPIGGKSEAFVVDLTPTPGQPRPVVSGAPDDAHTYCEQWSPDGTLLLCAWYSMSEGSSRLAADPDGGAPITMVDIPSSQYWLWSPNPAKHQLFATDMNDAPRVIMVDLANPDTAIKLADGFPTYSVSPLGNLLAYAAKPEINIVDLAQPNNPPDVIQTYQFAYLPPVASWSPDGKFISVTDDYHQQRLVRVDGTELSTPVALQGRSTATIYGAWQP
jgi:Tol biopolymer transport system component